MAIFSKLPDVTEWLCYEPKLMDPTAPTGLWFVADPLEVQALEKNAVSLHINGEWDDLDHCGAFFSAFKYVIIAYTNPQYRAEAVQQIRERIRGVPLTVAVDGFRGCTTLGGLAAKFGQDAVLELIGHTEDLPTYGLLNIADVKRPEKRLTTLSGIPALDRTIGGFADGELSIWTGKRGEGKSTLLGQILLEALAQGKRVCAYSGELQSWRFKEWLLLQAAGPEHLREVEDPLSGKKYYVVPAATEKAIDDWWDGELFLYDTTITAAHEPENIISLFRYSERRYGSSIFLVEIS
jgi:twinkle protein